MKNFYIKSVKGMKDYFNNDILIYHYIENIFKKLIENYSFNEVRFPIIENSLLYNKNFYNLKSINTFSKRMYSFNDKNNLNLSLRPEGTMSCVRMYLENKLFNLNCLNKLWYIGPMFRYENPQKGRFRQFNQIGLEIFGSNSLVSDLELILIINKFFKILNIDNLFTLEINSIGLLEDRKKYINYLNIKLKENKYLFRNLNIDKFDFSLFKKIDNNNINYINVLKKFSNIMKFINKNSLYNFNNLCKYLDNFNIKYKINFNLVRGLDYYNDLVFEWKYNYWNNNNTVCAGGRYDYLINNLYKVDIPAVGLSLGLDRLILMIKNNSKLFNNINKKIDIYIISYYNLKTMLLGLNIVEKILNSDLYFLNIYHDYFLYNNLSKLILKVIKMNCRILIIIGKNEFLKKNIIIKDLYFNNQFSFSIKKNIVTFISNLFKLNS